MLGTDRNCELGRDFRTSSQVGEWVNARLILGHYFGCKKEEQMCSSWFLTPNKRPNNLKLSS
jgi:hypothetical protein